MLQGLFLVFSAAVILFNLLADLLYARSTRGCATRDARRDLDPRRIAWLRRRRALAGAWASTGAASPG